MLLDLERLGLSGSYYSAAMYAERRRLAKRLGLAAGHSGAEPLRVDLDALLAPYTTAVAEAA